MTGAICYNHILSLSLKFIALVTVFKIEKNEKKCK